MKRSRRRSTRDDRLPGGRESAGTVLAQNREAGDEGMRRGRKLAGFLALGAVIVALIVYLYSEPLLQQAFPVRYGEHILRIAELTGMDPVLMLAIIHVESRFDSEAESPKGALGLMQVLPSTAREVAENLGLEDFHPDQLKDPETNLLIGAAYFVYLQRLFDGDIPVALAAYNGGLGNVRTWLNTGVWSGRLDDLGAIPYAETRNYVRRVLEAYEFYRHIYPDFATWRPPGVAVFTVDEGVEIPR